MRRTILRLYLGSDVGYALAGHSDSEAQSETITKYEMLNDLSDTAIIANCSYFDERGVIHSVMSPEAGCFVRANDGALASGHGIRQSRKHFDCISIEEQKSPH
jgi:hypothetical protein